VELKKRYVCILWQAVNILRAVEEVDQFLQFYVVHMIHLDNARKFLLAPS
jgi:hypothetical protein